MKDFPCYKEYRLVRLFYQDGTKKVYEAEHERFGFKRLVKEAKKGTEAAEMLYREALVLSKVKSPFIPGFYDFDDSQDSCFLAEELIPGETLERFMRNEKNISYGTLLSFAGSLCNALLALHGGETAFVHCDIKPSNLIVSGGDLKLIDFGAAVPEAPENMSLASYGSANYAAPEQKCGEMRTAATDIYAAGKIIGMLCECVEGTERFLHKRGLQKVRAAVRRATDENPGCRPSSVEEFRRELPFPGNGKSGKSLAKTCTLGVAGTHHGAGTTHIAVSIASFLASRGKRVALVDLSETHALSGLIQKTGKVPKDRTPVRVRDIWVIPEADTLLAGKARNGTYDFCVFDLGCGSNRRLGELLRCDKKIVVTDSAPWRTDRRAAVERYCENAAKPSGWWLFLNFSERERPKDLRHLSVNLEWPGFSPDPFENTVQNEKLFGKLLSAV